MKYNQSILEMEARKLEVMEKVLASRNDDEDMLFFRSFLPHVKKIPVEQKLQFRVNVPNLVEQYVYGSPLNVEIINE